MPKCANLKRFQGFQVKIATLLKKCVAGRIVTKFHYFNMVHHEFVIF